MVISLRSTATSGVDIASVTVQAEPQPQPLAVPGGLDSGSYVILVSTASGALVNTTSVKVEASDYFLVRENRIRACDVTLKPRVPVPTPHRMFAGLLNTKPKTSPPTTTPVFLYVCLT
eukprot:1172506-Prorocentrum_minimum.AAC.1